MLRSVARSLSIALRAAAGVVAIRRLIGVASAAESVQPTDRDGLSISVVVPARDEAGRIGPLLATIVGAPQVAEVIVVDDQSTDATADIARAAGAMVLVGSELPDGWAGKAWALQQGIEMASGRWVVTLDADTRPDVQLPAALVARASGDDLDLLTVAGRFDCPTVGSRWLHPAMLTTLVYRFGAPGSSSNRPMANGQCTVVPRQKFLDAGGMSSVSGEVVEDIALAHSVDERGGNVAFLDASDLLTVRMFESFDDTWHGWGRSLALPGIDGRCRQLFDLAVILLAQALPLPRLLFGRGDVIDVMMLAVRLGTLAGTRTAYARVDAPYWASPLADLPAVVAITNGVRRGRAQVWRGRRYD